MNRGRGNTDPPPGLTGSAPASKPNRLRRSFRQTQQTQTPAEVDSPQSHQPDFKTPTRIQRSRAGGGYSSESPHNDSDFQQDIIWDATSPSPNRLGKRGKKKPPGVVNISEIVNRIAPKHGRPTVVEPTLQQWIGDSATIPCTPDVQVPKPKKKSPRPNGVDDLLKLAKQFDFNMFRQDDAAEEEEEEEELQQSLELLSDDILDLEDGFSPSLPGNSRPAVRTSADVQRPLEQHMEDDLDLLFDGPTQHVSGSLSQVSQVRAAPREASWSSSHLSQVSQVRAAPREASGSSSHLSQVSQVRAAPREASGKPCVSSHAPSGGVSAKDEFEDDWENDDLLNDSLVFEMTQNPQNFMSPKHCSTQKPAVSKRPSPVKVQSAVSTERTDNVRQRSTFKLETNPNFSVRGIQTDTRTDTRVEYSSNTKFSSGTRVLVQAGSQRSWQPSQKPSQRPPQREPQKEPQKKPQRPPQTEPQRPPQRPPQTEPQRPPQRPLFHQSSSASNTSAPAQNCPINPTAVSSAVSDLLDEDLSSFFASDPVWDDPADDDLLCEMCDDLENQIQNAQSARQTLPASNQRAALRPSNWNQPPANQQPLAPRRHAGGSLAGGLVSGVQTKDSFRCTQARNTSGPTNGSVCVQPASGRVQAAPLGNARKDQFTFKKPSSPVSMVTSKAVGKCSAAEIELKKQQAMERRRQRLQAAQNLRAPT